jgi:lysophospholipase L1-like esterase
MGGTLAAAIAVVAVGLGVAMWLAIGRILEEVDRLPDNTPVAFLQNRQVTPDGPGSEGHTAQDGGSRVIVCVGDSITHGSISSNYVDALASRFGAGGFEFVNAGINGDLAYNVTQRLDEIIECKPDIVTVLIGTNDVNALTNQSNLRRYRKEQHLPRTPDQEWYRENLTEIVRRLQTDTDAKIALLSIPPIGEDPSHPAFGRSVSYGEIAKEIAADTGVDYLPLGATMVGYLEEHPGKSRLSKSHVRRLIVKVVFRRLVLKQSYGAISRANGNTLLTDHLHLNDTGAGLVADLIQEYLQQPAADG